jgi:hypothetical protein
MLYNIYLIVNMENSITSSYVFYTIPDNFNNIYILHWAYIYLGLLNLILKTLLVLEFSFYATTRNTLAKTEHNHQRNT